MIITILLFAALGWTGYKLVNALLATTPEGYEDAGGWHRGQPPRKSDRGSSGVVFLVLVFLVLAAIALLAGC